MVLEHRFPLVGFYAHSEPRSQSSTATQLAVIDELGGLFFAVFKAFISNIAKETQRGVTPTQMRFLQLIAHRPGLSNAEIATGLAVTTPSACTAINRLIKLGWAERHADARDKRCIRVYLTEPGRELVNFFQSRQAEKLEGLLAIFEERELTEFRDMVRRITAYIDNNSEQPQPTGAPEEKA